MAARIRSIKPEAPQHHRVGRLSIWARWLWLTMITQADDEGRLVADPGRLRLLAFGYDLDVTDVKVAELLAEIAAAGLIQTYVVSEERYASFPGWRGHQRIDRPSPSKLPPPPELRSTRPRRGVDLRSTRARAGSEGIGSEGIESEGIAHPTTTTPNAEPIGPAAPQRVRSRAKGHGPAIVEAGFDELWAAYPVKEGKGAALKAFQKLAPSNGTVDAMMAGLERWKASDRWARGFIVHLATWLHQRRWEDQPASAQPMFSGKTQGNVEALRRFVARGAVTGEGQS